MALRIGGKNASIILKGADQKIILDLIGEMSAALIAETEREIDAVHQAAQDGWPGNPKDPTDPVWIAQGPLTVGASGRSNTDTMGRAGHRRHHNGQTQAETRVAVGPTFRKK